MTLFLPSLLTNLQMIGLGSEREESRKETVSNVNVVNSNVSSHTTEQINAKLTGFGGVFVNL